MCWKILARLIDLRLMPHMRTRERVFSTLSVIGAALGGAGLILLAVYDTARYTREHRVFLLVFMLGVTLSAIFTIVEVRASFVLALDATFSEFNASLSVPMDQQRFRVCSTVANCL